MISRFKVIGKHLIADIEFDMANSFATDIARQYRDGYLNAVSGFPAPLTPRAVHGPRDEMFRGTPVQTG
jgi:hypothetical protein